MKVVLVSVCLLTTISRAENSYNNQLPQLINADGSLTAHHDQQPLSNGYSNYYPQNQQPFQQAGNYLSQAGSELKQGAQNFGNEMRNQVQNAGEALGNAPRNFVNGVQDLGSRIGQGFDNLGNRIGQGFDNMVQSGLNKLNDLKGQFAEKFRPLLDNAIQIFQTPRTEKEKWNEVRAFEFEMVNSLNF